MHTEPERASAAHAADDDTVLARIRGQIDGWCLSLYSAERFSLTSQALPLSGLTSKRQCCCSLRLLFFVLSSFFAAFFFFPLLLLSVMSGWLSRRRKAVSSSLCQSVAVVWYRPLVRQIYPFPFQRLCAAGVGSSFKIPSNLLQFLTNFLQFLQNSVSLADPRGSPEFCIKSWNSSGTSCDVS